MSSKYGFLCIVVLGLILLLILKNYEIWTRPVGWVPEKNIGKRLSKKPETKEVLPTFGTQKDATSVKSYTLIAEKNLFNPERKDFPTGGGPMGNGRKQLVRPQIILYGVTIAGEYQAASMSNPGRPLQKGERETFTVIKGERIGEYKLVKISSDRVTLEAEGDSFDVLLYDQSMAKKRTNVRTETKPAAVTSTQPVPAPAAPAPIPQTAPAAIPQTNPPPGSVQGGVATPAPASPAIPRPDFPRRRASYPAQVPAQPTEGN